MGELYTLDVDDLTVDNLEAKTSIPLISYSGHMIMKKHAKNSAPASLTVPLHTSITYSMGCAFARVLHHF